MSGAQVRIDATRLQRLLGADSGPGVALLRRKAERVATLARINAAGHGSIPAGIVVGPVVNKSIKVVSTNIHSLYVHEGTRPHRIVPRRRGGVLRFVVDGRVVWARVVNHPGNAADPYLRNALREAR